MNDIQLISDLRAAMDDEATAIRLPAGMADLARKSARARQRKRGLALSVTAAGLAAGLMVTVTSLQAPPSQRGPGTGAVHGIRLTAVQVLDHAATSALAQPATAPRPGQFVYWTTVDSADGRTRTWRSVDGARNGLVVSAGKKTVLWGCRHGWQTVRPDPGSGLSSLRQRCVADPGYLPGLPTSLTGLRHYLAKKFGARTHSAAVLSKVTQTLLGQEYLLATQRAALYKFFTTLRGLKVIDQVRDYTGRPGVGVSFSTAGFTAIWIFDHRTFAYLGSTERANGKFIFGSAVLKVAIVNGWTRP